MKGVFPLYIATEAQMRAIEARCADTGSMTYDDLMKCAGQALVSSVVAALQGISAPHIVILCGKGNNGGDGFACGTMLLERGYRVTLFSLGMSSAAGGLARPLETCFDDFSIAVKSCDLIVDAIYGIGLCDRLPDALFSVAAEAVNAASCPVIAADIPSGLLCDSGRSIGAFIKASETVTFTLRKPVHVLARSKDFCGRVICCDIGIPPACIGELSVSYYTDADFAEALPPRRQDTHKGHYGKLLIVAGSVGYAGAACLAARAAMRVGAGLVTLLVPNEIYSIVASKMDEVTVFPLASVDGKVSLDTLPFVLEKASVHTKLLLGCGLGQSEGVSVFVRAVLEAVTLPVLLDADGINALSGEACFLQKVACPLILTPHPLELRRLLSYEAESSPEGILLAAKELNCILVFKGHRTITALPSGQVFINSCGNAGMAKAGSGDVLAGVISGLCVQGIPLEKAVPAGVYLHAAAGDAAAEKLGQYAMLPSDMIDTFPAILRGFDL